MSPTLQQRAEAAMPGGVNSPVRAFRAVGGKPIYAQKARGTRLETTDGDILIDFCMSFGPLILGHGHNDVIEAVSRAILAGTSFAVTTPAEIELAELIKKAIPSIERVRLVSSGTEACMTAVRLARGFTGRNKILKFSGCYHGHSDSMLVKAGSGAAGIATASSAGVPPALAAETLVAPYNNTQAVSEFFADYGDDIAAIVVEPVAANAGLILPAPNFLEHLRAQADAGGALLVFDEVITGFRLGFGGYQDICGVKPDLTCLGKIIGGGMPIGAVGGRADVMEKLAPLGPVYQAGTLSGNPISVAAGLATLRWLQRHKPYAELERRTTAFVQSLEQAAKDRGLAIQFPRIGSMFSLFFTDRPVRSFEDALAADTKPFAPLFHALLKNGVYIPPSPFEACFLSVAHDEDTLREAERAWKTALETL